MCYNIYSEFYSKGGLICHEGMEQDQEVGDQELGAVEELARHDLELNKGGIKAVLGSLHYWGYCLLV